jgi:hypothetical protein
LTGFLLVRRGLADPSDEAVGAYQQRAQAQPILGVAGDIDDPISPAACKLCGSVEVQQQAFPVSEEFAELPPVA